MIIRHAHNSETSLQTAVRQKTSRESKLSRHNQSLGKVAVCVSAALCVDPHCTHTHTHTHTHTGQRQWSITTALTTRVHPNARLWCEWVKAPTDQTLCTDLDSHVAHTHTRLHPHLPQQKRPSQTRLFRLPDPIFFPVSL